MKYKIMVDQLFKVCRNEYTIMIDQLFSVTIEM